MMMKLNRWYCTFLLQLVVFFSYGQWEDLSPLPNGPIENVWAIDDQIAYVSSLDQILKTTDGGQNWTVVYKNEVAFLRDLYFFDAMKGIAVGGGLDGRYRIIQTTNGGRTWEEQILFRSIIADDGFRALDFIDENVGYAVGHAGRYVKTTDGGQSWAELQLPVTDPLADIDFIDSQNGFVLTLGEELLVTNDGGATWNKYNTIFNNYRSQIFFFTPNMGYHNGFGVLRKTIDGGKTWEELEWPVGGYTYYFTDPDIGYCGTTDGEIYKTIDGGFTWYLQKFEIPDVFEIHFPSDQIGWATGGSFFGRGSVHRTINGGGIGANIIVQDSSCPGDSILLRAQTIDVESFEWLIADSLIGNGPEVYFIPSQKGDYQVDLIAGNGNQRKQFSETFRVYRGSNIPDFKITYFEDSICMGDIIEIDFDNPSNDFQLSIKSGNQFLLQQEQLRLGHFKWSSPPLSESRTFEFYKDDAGCNPYLLFTQRVEVIPPPNTDLEMELVENPICENGFAEIQINNAEINRLYQVYYNGAAQNNPVKSDGNTLIVPSKQLEAPGTLTVQSIASRACSTFLKQELPVNIMPVEPVFIQSTTNLALTESLTLSNLSADTLTFEWQFGSGASVNQSIQRQPRPINYSEVGDYPILLIGKSQQGCLDTTFQQVTVYDPSQLEEQWVLFNDNYGPFTSTGIFTVDDEQNVYTGSESRNELFEISSTSGSQYNELFNGAVVSKHNALGVLQWTSKIYSAEGIANAFKHVNLYAIDTDQAGNVLVTGSIYSGNPPKTSFESSSGETIEINEPMSTFLVKYNSSGKVLWVTYLSLRDENDKSISIRPLALDCDSENTSLLALKNTQFLTNGTLKVGSTNGSERTFNNESISLILKIDENGSLIQSIPYNERIRYANYIQRALINSIKSDHAGGFYILADGSESDHRRLSHGVKLSKYDATGTKEWDVIGGRSQESSALSSAFYNSKGMVVDEKGDVYLLCSTVSSGVSFTIDQTSRSNVFSSRNAYMFGKISRTGALQFERIMTKISTGGSSHPEGLGIDYDSGLIYLKAGQCNPTFRATSICANLQLPENSLTYTVWDTTGHLLEVISGDYENSYCRIPTRGPEGIRDHIKVKNGNIYSIGQQRLGTEPGQVGNFTIPGEKQNFLLRFKDPQHFQPFITVPSPRGTDQTCFFRSCSNDTTSQISVSYLFDNVRWSVDGREQPNFSTPSINPTLDGTYVATGDYQLNKQISSPSSAQVRRVDVDGFRVVANDSAIVATLYPFDEVRHRYYYLRDENNLIIDFGNGKNRFIPTEPGVYSVSTNIGGCTVEASVEFPGETDFIDEDGDGFFADVDCDDQNIRINPVALEIPENGIDEDCNGEDFIPTGSANHPNIHDIYLNPTIGNPIHNDMVGNPVREGFTDAISSNQAVAPNLGVFPNPTAGKIAIQLDGVSRYRIEVYNQLGHLIHQQELTGNLNGYQVDLANQQDGMYHLKIVNLNSSQVLTKKIIKL